MTDQPQIQPPVLPAPPVDPPCAWCGERPAQPYEVAPPIYSTTVSLKDGKTMRVKTIKKRATMAYACASHRETFDRRKRETEERKAAEREARKFTPKDQRPRRRRAA